MAIISKLATQYGEIAYHKIYGKSPGVIFLHGFRSDMNGEKAIAIEKYCTRNGQSFIRFDMMGHGKSYGDFSDGNISIWLENTLEIIDKIATGPQILIGSSMGGWVAMLAAKARKNNVIGLIGIASAPDFTRYLLWDKLDGETQQLLQNGNIYNVPSDYCEGEGYPIKYQLITDGENHLLLESDIDITCPVRLIHGMNDVAVPHQFSMLLADKITSNDVVIKLSKRGDHRMSDEKSLNLLLLTLQEVTDICTKRK